MAVESYLDNNATTQPDPRVVEAMLPYLGGQFGNPSSLHWAGRVTRAAIDRAREQVAALVGVSPAQVIFTSGGTEANNLALRGAAATFSSPGRIAVSAVEHASVLEAAAGMARQGWDVAQIPVDRDGRVDMARFGAQYAHGLRIVSVMLANNETGVVQDVAAVAATARQSGAVIHTDAVQAAGKMAVDFAATGAHMMSLSAHKFYGPKGVGALILDKNIDLQPLLSGGGHERGLRSGTENVPGIVGFGVAAQLAREELEARRTHLEGLRDRLVQGLRALPGVSIVAEGAERLPNTLMVMVAGVDGETLVMELDREGVAVSSGSACGSADAEPSHVLLAMGVEREAAQGAIRISLGKDNNEGDVDRVCAALAVQIDRLASVHTRMWA